MDWWLHEDVAARILEPLALHELMYVKSVCRAVCRAVRRVLSEPAWYDDDGNAAAMARHVEARWTKCDLPVRVEILGLGVRPWVGTLRAFEAVHVSRGPHAGRFDDDDVDHDSLPPGVTSALTTAFCLEVDGVGTLSSVPHACDVLGCLAPSWTDASLACRFWSRVFPYRLVGPRRHYFNPFRFFAFGSMNVYDAAVACEPPLLCGSDGVVRCVRYESDRYWASAAHDPYAYDVASEFALMQA